MEYEQEKGFETKFNCQIRFTNITSNITANKREHKNIITYNIAFNITRLNQPYCEQYLLDVYVTYSWDKSLRIETTYI